MEDYMQCIYELIKKKCWCKIKLFELDEILSYQTKEHCDTIINQMQKYDMD